MARRIVGYISNPNCPDCNGTAGEMRLEVWRETWGMDFAGDTPGARNMMVRRPRHCRNCAVYAPAEEG